MRKRLSIPFILLASIPLFSVAHSAGACTGFAVYSGDSAWYGMNFDYPESSEIGFTVSAHGERIVFRMVFEAAETLFSTVAQVRELLGEVLLVHAPFPTLHLLVADPGGNALITEVGDVGNAVAEMEDDFLVMTNFRNADFTGLSRDLVSGVGADRYITASSLLSEFEGIVSPLEVMYVLSKARSEDEVFVTRVSMVFDPSSAWVRCAGVWELL